MAISEEPLDTAMRLVIATMHENATDAIADSAKALTRMGDPDARFDFLTNAAIAANRADVWAEAASMVEDALR